MTAISPRHFDLPPVCDQTPENVAESLRSVLIEHGLRRVQAATNTHVITVEEPSIWEPMDPLKTEIREIGL